MTWESVLIGFIAFCLAGIAVRAPALTVVPMMESTKQRIREIEEQRERVRREIDDGKVELAGLDAQLARLRSVARREVKPREQLQDAVVRVVALAGDAVRCAEVCRALDEEGTLYADEQTVRSTLTRLVDGGRICRVGRGRFEVA